MVGTEETRLVIVRGNSGSGKSSVAAGMRERFERGLALVSQDNIRCVVLCEHDRPGAANIGLIDVVALLCQCAAYLAGAKAVKCAGGWSMARSGRQAVRTWALHTNRPSGS